MSKAYEVNGDIYPLPINDAQNKELATRFKSGEKIFLVEPANAKYRSLDAEPFESESKWRVIKQAYWLIIKRKFPALIA